MKTSNYPQSLVEIRIAQHASRMHKIHAMKPVVFIIIVVVIAMISKVYAQSGLEDRIVAYLEKTDMRMVSFMQDLPQAEELPGYINTCFREVRPIFSPDGKTMYFCRQNLPENTVGVMDYEDIWYSTYNIITDTWSSPVRMQEPINNLRPYSVNFVSVTGDTLLLDNDYKKNGNMRSGMYTYFSTAISDTNSDIYRVSLASLYKWSTGKSTNALAESGLQDINMKDFDASTGGGRYANLDQ